MARVNPIPIVLLTASLLIGCVKDEDDRLAEIAAEHTRQQAAQNQEMARLNREVAEGGRRLVEAEARSREELLAMSREVHVQHDQLEADRRTLAVQRQRESLLAPVLSTISMLLVCSLPLLCWYLLHGLRHEGESEAALNEVLIVELTSEQSMLLPAPPRVDAIEHHEDRPGADGTLPNAVAK